MKSFIDELVDKLLVEHGHQLEHVHVIFPNRRAGLFFRKSLSQQISEPIWMPEVTSLEDFVIRETGLDKLSTIPAVMQLYQCYATVQPEPEPLDRFYFWGEMMLKDFDEVDHHLINAQQLFTGVKSQKELDEAFYFISEEERKVIQEFWATFLPEPTDVQTAFLKIWQIMLPVYELFRKSLLEKHQGYIGLIYREFVDRLKRQGHPSQKQYVFAGFNALTGSETAILSWFVQEKQATIHWDIDAYYVQDTKQEAGFFIRQLMRHEVLGPTFPKEYPSHFSQPKQMVLSGISLEAGQPRLLAEDLLALTRQADFVPEKTVIVLPQEHMLLPMLHAIPEEIAALNITMGFALKDTPVYTLLDSLLHVQETLRKTAHRPTAYYYRHVMEVVGHPLVTGILPLPCQELQQWIRKHNAIYLPEDQLPEALRWLFISSELPLRMLKSILQGLYLQWEAQPRREMEQRIIATAYERIMELEKALGTNAAKLEIDFIISLFQKVFRAEKVPFEGEPLLGIQIMGTLETRNLDFENVFVLSMNEGSWPAHKSAGSFIPYNIRRAFNMPVPEHQDAIYAYLFYRLMQRAKRVYFYHNTVSAFNMNGEPSRYIRQLETESGHLIHHRQLANSVKPANQAVITIKKDTFTYDRLKKFTHLATGKNQTSLTPSALDTYLTCRLRFYFKYVEELFEPDDISEQLSEAHFGTILHDALQILYGDFIKKRKDKTVTEADFFLLKTGVDGAIQEAYRGFYHADKATKFKLEGRNIIAASIIRKLMLKTLEIDQAYAPFELIGLESRDGYKLTLPVRSGDMHYDVRIKGIIDRIDRKGNIIRIIDYKTGKDEKKFAGIESLTDRENSKRQKAPFQLFFYALLAAKSEKWEHVVIQPALYNRKDFFVDVFDWRIRDGDHPVEDFEVYREAFEQQLSALVAEIWDPTVPFDQVADPKACQYCPYNGICGR